MPANNEDLTNEIICTCTGTTYGDVADLFEQGFDLDGIASKKGVLSGCGGCEWDVELLLSQLANKQKNRVAKATLFNLFSPNYLN